MYVLHISVLLYVHMYVQARDCLHARMHTQNVYGYVRTYLQLCQCLGLSLQTLV